MTKTSPNQLKAVRKYQAKQRASHANAIKEALMFRLCNDLLDIAIVKLTDKTLGEVASLLGLPVAEVTLRIERITNLLNEVLHA